ncbi:MAG: hypothetical protein OEY51_08230, partial [Cyclobacteriaceae bacterium]|nr:hypothetical protein [Cyclobacteriaceae bacterium]
MKHVATRNRFVPGPVILLIALASHSLLFAQSVFIPSRDTIYCQSSGINEASFVRPRQAIHRDSYSMGRTETASFQVIYTGFPADVQA